MKLTEYSSQEITLNVQYIFQTIFTAKKVSTFINRERSGVIRYGHFLYRISYISCLFIWACPSDSVTVPQGDSRQGRLFGKGSSFRS